MLVEYIKQQGTLVPFVDNNWSITGVNLASPYRDQVVKLVNEGKLDVPYAKSLNVDKLKAEGIIK